MNSSNHKNYKNLAYENLSDVPFLSVVGIKEFWFNHSPSFIKFFVLINKSQEDQVLASLRSYDNIVSKIDDLLDYKFTVQQRIIASLALNSLGDTQNNNYLYNNGSLIVCDDLNFGIKKEYGFVCLKIELDRYLVLSAHTNTFNSIEKIEELYNYNNCIFQISQFIDGDLWSGSIIKPVNLKTLDRKSLNQEQLNNLYILKANQYKRNTVPYWNLNVDSYSHGKLFVLAQIVQSINDKFKDLIKLSFTDNKDHLCDYFEAQTGKMLLPLLEKALKNLKLYFSDPFCEKQSIMLIEQFKTICNNLFANTLIFVNTQEEADIIIRLCEDKDEKDKDDYYIKGQELEQFSSYALQHIIYNRITKTATNTYLINKNVNTVSNNTKQPKEPKLITKEATRRILIELAIKYSLIKRTMLEELTFLTDGFEFIRYKIKNNNVHGASLKILADGTMQFHKYGILDDNFLNLQNFDYFAKTTLNFYKDSAILNGIQDYKVLKKEGNVYLIIDSNEIPVLNTKEIDELYYYMKKDPKKYPVSMFKRREIQHKYIGGILGGHLWYTAGLEEGELAYAYSMGFFYNSIKTRDKNYIVRPPRVRYIFILAQENPHLVQLHINQIMNMLKVGFGRYNELMTYPFPFKFLYEFLNNETLKKLKCHWENARKYLDSCYITL